MRRLRGRNRARGMSGRELAYGPYAGMGFNPFSVPGIAVMSPAAAGILSMGDINIYRHA